MARRRCWNGRSRRWPRPARCSIIGVYPQTARFFPIGMAMNKNLTVKMGNCPHRKYMPMLVDMVRNGTIDPTQGAEGGGASRWSR